MTMMQVFANKTQEVQLLLNFHLNNNKQTSLISSFFSFREHLIILKNSWQKTHEPHRKGNFCTKSANTDFILLEIILRP